MLPFQEQIISDLLEDPNGGLVVLSSGLPLTSLISSLLLVFHGSGSGPGSVIILSASDSQKSAVSRCVLPSQNPTNIVDIAGDLAGDNRAALYASGSVIFVTARVLVADLLASRCLPSHVSALIILNAHRVADTSTECFIVRLLRSHGSIASSTSASAAAPLVPILAFSDRPHAMVAGFAKAERLMKGLFIRRLHLWPRFHVLVAADVEAAPPEVIDIRVPVTPAMKGIQGAVLEAMDACLKELSRSNKVDVEDLTIEKGLFKSFDEIVRRQLDPIWHTLGKKTKQLVSDLRTLRKLLDYLVRYDAVTYLKYLDTLRVSEGVQSVWIFAHSSHRIFELAKKRVYKVVGFDGVCVDKNDKGAPIKKRKITHFNKKGKSIDIGCSSNKNEGVDANGTIGLEEILEEAPKWKLLQELLEEIAEERIKETETRDKLFGGNGGNDDIVLVACKDEYSCLQLEECILKGSEEVMRATWEKYLLGKVELHGLQKNKRKKAQGSKGFGLLDGVPVGASGDKTDGYSAGKVEKDALLSAASKIMQEANEEIDSVKTSKVTKRKGNDRKKKKYVGSTAAPCTSIGDVRAENGGIQGTHVDTVTHECTTDAENKKDAPSCNVQSRQDAKPLPPIQFYAMDSDQHIFDVWKPSTIVVYHPDVTFVREIEIYKAENPSTKLKVYFLFYEESAEAQKFDASIRRENGAFESLIRQKSLMMIPVDQNGRCIGPSISHEPETARPLNSITRKAGGRRPVEKETKVIVDMREFMSSLPNVLHQKGMRVMPVTLEVGDYVLSPLICVERKSISDLYQSFASGRLYHQVETMVRYYKIPVLLIEFSQDKSFSFQSANEISEDVSPTNIISKLCLLVLHFPRLRLLWSRGMHATADIFSSLKTNQDEPDESKAARVGVPSEDGTDENDVRAEIYNTSAVEFLRRLPGVTDVNYRALMDGCNNLAELALLPVEKLAELMGGRKSAQTLKEFLDAKCPTML